MAIEIEHKFTVKNDSWKRCADTGTVIKQGYLNSDKRRTTRVRIAGDCAFITIKGSNVGISRFEFEYQIPLSDALEIMHLCEQPVIDKIRYKVVVGAHIWELDVFFGDNEGLVLAEVELAHEDELFDIPDWVHENVSGDPRYFNSALIKAPYSTWK